MSTKNFISAIAVAGCGGLVVGELFCYTTLRHTIQLHTFVICVRVRVLG